MPRLIASAWVRPREIHHRDRNALGDDHQITVLKPQRFRLNLAAKCIALAVMDLREDDPRRMLSGEAFTSAGIHGAVESDFFDWVIADPAGRGARPTHHEPCAPFPAARSRKRRPENSL